jgi:hypothetical protein
MSHSQLRRSAALFSLTLAAAGCSDSTGSTDAGSISFNVATKPSAAALVGAAMIGEETLTDGTNTLVITSAQLVLREIELERQGMDDCEAVTGDDDCEELELGPIALDLPLGAGGAVRNFTVDVTPGTYDEIEFEIHKPESSDDAAFIAAHPELDGSSIRIVGTFNGTAFTFTSELDVEQEFDLVPPLVVSETTGAELTLLADLDSWFRGEGGTLVDPATANKGEPNEGLVKENIEQNLHAFEDDDQDGIDD